MNASVTLHIGLHKTGTASLQKLVFPRCESLRFLCTDTPEFVPFQRYAGFSDPIYFDPNKARTMIDSLLDTRRPNLISNEGFSGPLHAGELEFGLDHRDAVLRNLSAAFPEARVILTLRRQDRLARSFYRQYVRSGGTRRADRYFGYAKGTTAQPLVSRNRFRFLPYVRRVEELFPAGMLLLTHEEMVRDPAHYLGRMSDFLGVSLPDLPPRKLNLSRLGPFGMECTRIMNHFFRSYLNPAGILPGLPMRRNHRLELVSPVALIHDRWPRPYRGNDPGLSGRLAARILEEMREDNQRLDKQYDLNLKEYGYY